MLVDVFAAVNAAIIAAGQAPSTDAATNNAWFGAEKLAKETGTNKYVWVPLAEQPAAPTRGPNGPSSVGAPRGLFGRICPVEIHCWGADGGSSDPIVPYQNAELLFQQLAQAIQKTLTPRSFKYEGGGFEQLPQENRAGRVYVARFAFFLQVVDPTPQTARVTGVQLSGTIETGA